jgi:glycosyltransferase involved in cell wall biosynthesis
VRILHLVDPASPGGGPATLRLVAEATSRAGGAVHDVLIIGNTGHLRLAGRCGLSPRGRIAAPLNRPGLGRAGLRSFLRAWEPVTGGYDLLHAWTLPSAALALLEGRPLLATVLVVPEEAPGVAGRWVIRRLRRRSVPVLAADPILRGRLEAAGCGPGQVSVVPPAVDGEVIGFEQRALLRERWGADETSFVVALLGEPLRWADSRFVVDVLGRVALTRRDVRLVLHDAMTEAGGLHPWLGRLGLGDLVVVDGTACEPWRIVAGLDAALVAGGTCPGVLPMLWAMAAGVPAVAPATGPITAVVEDGRNGLLFEPGDVNGAAARLMELHDDAGAAARIGGAGRTLVERRFNPDDFAARLNAVYAQCRKGEPIRVGAVGPATETGDPSARSAVRPSLQEAGGAAAKT